jgi:hypothetical protein
MGITIIHKGSGWAGKRSPDPEQALHERIEKGSVTDSDISTIKKTGGKLMKHLLERENTQIKKTRDMKRKYGNTFDGIDNDGNLYKDMAVQI